MSEDQSRCTVHVHCMFMMDHRDSCTRHMHIARDDETRLGSQHSFSTYREAPDSKAAGWPQAPRWSCRPWHEGGAKSQEVVRDGRYRYRYGPIEHGLTPHQGMGGTYLPVSCIMQKPNPSGLIYNQPVRVTYTNSASDLRKSMDCGLRNTSLTVVLQQRARDGRGG